MTSPVALLLWFSAIGTGVMAGTYFGFSAFVMTSLGRVQPAVGMRAMQSINATILGTAFMPLFFATTLISLGLAVLGALRWSDPGSAGMMLAGVVYVGGMFLCTVLFNVPLNDALAAADPASAEGRAVWQTYLTVWTRWNHLRTAASLLASGLYIAALVARSAGR